MYYKYKTILYYVANKPIKSSDLLKTANKMNF